jgi:translocation and assembly module TamB
VIPTFSAEYQQVQIANNGPIRVDYANSVLTLQPGELKGTDTSIKFQGRVPLKNTAAMNVTAQGTVNLKLIRIFSPDIQSSGAVQLNVSTRGTSGGHPQVEGEIRLQKVSIITPSAPVGLENMNGVLTVANDRIHINQLTGQSGGGTVSIGGSIAYKPQVQFDVAVDAKSVRVLYSGIRTVLDGNVALTGTTEGGNLNGRVLIDSLSFTPDFDLAGVMAQSSTPSIPSPTPTLADKIQLDVAVQSSSDLSAVSSELSVEGTANLHIVNTAANPVILGRTDITSGEVFFLKQRYQLERGIINFINPSQTEPVVNVLITTVIQQYNLSLSIVGPVSKLRTTYTSDPPLPPVDIINLIARGQTTEQAAPGNFDANQVIAGQLAGQVSSRIGKLAGISSLTIDPLIGGNNQNPSARVAIQQRVTRNFIFTFSTDVTNPQAEVIQGEYQLTPRWSVSASRDQYGGFSFDGKYHTTF